MTPAAIVSAEAMVRVIVSASEVWKATPVGLPPVPPSTATVNCVFSGRGSSVSRSSSKTMSMVVPSEDTRAEAGDGAVVSAETAAEVNVATLLLDESTRAFSVGSV